MIRPRQDPVGLDGANSGAGPLFDAQPRFAGTDLQHTDFKRLKNDCDRVIAVMACGTWQTREQTQELVEQRFDRHVSKESIARYSRHSRSYGMKQEKESLGGGLFKYRLVAVTS